MENDFEEDELIVDRDSLFYYVECPFCTMRFAVWDMLKDTGFLLDELPTYMAVTDTDIIKIFCPRCGKEFPLAVAKAPEVFLQPSPFDEKVTKVEAIRESYNFLCRCLKCDYTYDANVPRCPKCGSTEEQKIEVRYEKKE